jgi:4-oxalocrotonate tautomerase
MPHIQITLLQGRTPEQKRRIAKRITETIVEEAGTTADGVSIAFVEVSPADFARAGVLVLDRKKN